MTLFSEITRDVAEAIMSAMTRTDLVSCSPEIEPRIWLKQRIEELLVDQGDEHGKLRYIDDSRGYSGAAPTDPASHVRTLTRGCRNK